MFRTAIILGNRKTKPNAVGAQLKKNKKFRNFTSQRSL